VTMVPGDLVLYESHSVLHGVSGYAFRSVTMIGHFHALLKHCRTFYQRPFPLKGRFMANVFVHFEPIGPVGKELLIDENLPSYVIPGK
jgi:prolyl 4-hydroxylase